MTLLEQEGFVRTRPRRGIYVVRKSKREIVEMITVMAALESMAARLAAERASDAEIAGLHRLMDRFRAGNDGERLDEYSDANIAFHQAIIKMSGCALLSEMTENLFLHMRAIRKITIHQDNRAARSIIDHFRIIEALERREPSLPNGWRASIRWGSPGMSRSTAIFSMRCSRLSPSPRRRMGSTCPQFEQRRAGSQPPPGRPMERKHDQSP